jgi:hypothetical protein
LASIFRSAMERAGLIAAPLLAPVLTISGLADITTMHQIDVSADGDGTQ